MKVFTYDNLTTGRKQETLHAETEQEVIDTMSKLGYQVKITQVFDPEALFKEPNSTNDILPPSAVAPEKQTVVEKKDTVPVFFETNGIKFKMVGADMFKQEWVEVVENKQDKYKVIKQLRGKSDSIRENDITDEIKLYVKEWVEVEKQYG